MGFPRLLAPLLPILVTGCGRAAPGLDDVAPGLVCPDQGEVTLTLEGTALGAAVTGLLGSEQDLLLPSVAFHPASGLAAGSPAPEGGAVPVDPARVILQGPGRAEVLLDGALGLEPGTWDVGVTAVSGEEAVLAGALAVAGPPAIQGALPDRLCHEAETVTLRLEGEGFLLLADGAVPQVLVGGVPATVREGQGCAALGGPVSGEVCTALLVDVAPGILSLGSAPVEVVNPAPAGCAAPSPLTLQVVMPPEVDGVTPEVTCTQGGTLTVRGGPFVEGATVEVDGVDVVGITWVDEGTLEVRLGSELAPGTYDLRVVDPSGCITTLPDGVVIVPEPTVFGVDPPVVPAGTAVVVVAWLADQNAEISDLWIEHGATGEIRALAWTDEGGGALRFSVPPDLAAGHWQVGVLQGAECTGNPAAGFEVSGAPTVSISEVEPPFAWTFDHTPVEIRAADPLPAGMVGFQDVPEVYLLGAGGEDARRLLGVRFHDAGRLTAIVPPELDTGVYGLLVVNPDGAHGLLEGAIEVTWEPPPEVRVVVPAALEKSTDESLTIQGTGFRDPVVSLVCMDGGVERSVDAVVEAWTYGSIEARVSTRGFNQALCLVTVTNDDGTWTRWSAVSIVNPSQNLFPFEEGTDLVVARRAPAAAAARSTTTERWVYAIGGDDGDTVGALDSVEVAPVDPWGTMGAWALLDDPLPEPRTLAGVATVGRFVYLVGGDDGGGALETVLRAMVLDPLDVPWVEEVSLESTADGGLGAGRWSYRVSALFESSHPSNPGGESLAGEPVSITLPATGTGWLPTLCWSPVDGAAGYRVYRGVEAGAPSSEVGWLADVPTELYCFQDDGAAVDPTVVPLANGAVGAWMELPSMTTARAAPCVAVARDPRSDPEVFHLYAAGGQGADGVLLDSVEVLDVTVEREDLQSTGAWWGSEAYLSEARWQCGGFTIDGDRHSVVEDPEVWIAFGGGLDGRGATGAVDLGRVGSGGVLEGWGAGRSMSPARAGFGAASASDFLYAFGGTQGTPSSSGVSGELADDGGLTIQNWNSLGLSMAVARYLPGSAQESAVIFILGGATETGGATASTDFTHY